MKLILATKNAGKIAEMKAMLALPGVEVLSLDDLPGEPPEVVEDGGTFVENARKKALLVAQWSGLPALADDSGLVVDALDGDPGVHSSRYAGKDGDMEANMDLLLLRMSDVPDEKRTACFISVISLACPDGRTWETEGRVNGVITRDRIGEGGFGYDPVFFYHPAEMTFAQMGTKGKNRVSHRSEALGKMAELLPIIEKELEK
jgi:XTP/dITP diphosphohydrolase